MVSQHTVLVVGAGASSYNFPTAAGLISLINSKIIFARQGNQDIGLYDKSVVGFINEQVANDRLNFSSNDIDIIFVNTKSQKAKILTHRSELKGRVRLWAERH